jgi:hypothetical protein
VKANVQSLYLIIPLFHFYVLFLCNMIVYYSNPDNKITRANVSITSPDNKIAYFSDEIKWQPVPEDAPYKDFSFYYKFIFSPETQNVPLQKTITVNILLTEVEESNGKIYGATSQSLPIVVSDLKPNFMIGTKDKNSAKQISKWIFYFMLLQTL